MPARRSLPQVRHVGALPRRPNIAPLSDSFSPAMPIASVSLRLVARGVGESSRRLPPLPSTTLMPPANRRRQVTIDRLPALKRYPVASIDMSRGDVALPFGMPRRVNAATLKALAGGDRSDQLLRKTGEGWEFVDDRTMVDLSDNTQEFRVGALTIFS